jgi:hypothetical protein
MSNTLKYNAIVVPPLSRSRDSHLVLHRPFDEDDDVLVHRGLCYLLAKVRGNKNGFSLRLKGADAPDIFLGYVKDQDTATRYVQSKDSDLLEVIK